MPRKILPTGFKVNGKLVSLRDWAAHNNVPYSTIHRRWQNGCKTEESLLKGYVSAESAEFTEQEIEWVKETRFARAGMTYEWKIACDLIGAPRYRAEEMRKAVEG